MKILFPSWKTFGLEDITETFRQMATPSSIIHRNPEITGWIRALSPN